MPVPVLLLHNLSSAEARFRASCEASDAGVSHAVAHVAEALAALSCPCRVAGVRRLAEVPGVVQAGDEPVVFNLVERLDGGEQECNFVPVLCRALGRGCTGGTSESLVLTLDKDLTKRRLGACGVRTPAGVVVPVGGAVPEALPGGAWFVKPLCSDGSEGIEADSLVRPGDRAALAAAVARVHARIGQPALVEEFIAGREFNLAVVEQGGVPVPLPVSEIDFTRFPADRPHFVDYAVKWQPGLIAGQLSPRRVPAQVAEELAGRLREAAVRAWQACGGQDYARVDTRVNAAGDVYVLDVNINCDLSPLAGLPAAWQATGAPFAGFVRQMVENALRRRAASHDPL